MSEGPVLVTGATGTTGSAVVDGLAARGVPVRAAVRDPRRYEGGGEPVRFDFTDPTSYDAANGVRAVYLVRPPALGNVERDLFPAVAAMENRGVERVVLLSVLGAERLPVLPHRRIERRLERSRVEWTTLRAAYFAQNLETVHREEIREGRLAVPAGDGRVGTIDARDVAAVAVRCLTEPEHAGRAYDLTGPEAVSFGDLARVLSDVLPYRVAYTDPSLPRFLLSSRMRGVPTGRALVMAGLYTAARLGLSARVNDDARRVLGREPHDVHTYARDRRAVWS
jgi:uncharacterized protein YbjT (DUF2867 family)